MGEKSGQVCVITRCNYTLFNEAVNVCCANNNTKVGFVGVSHILSLVCFYFKKVILFFFFCYSNFFLIGEFNLVKNSTTVVARYSTWVRRDSKCMSDVSSNFCKIG